MLNRRRLFTFDGADADTQRRGRNLVIIALGVSAMCLISAPLTLIQPEPAPQLAAALIGAVVSLALVALARRGRVEAAALGLIALLVGGLFVTPLVSRQVGLTPPFMVVPVLVAAAVARPRAVFATAALAIAVLVAQGALLASEPQHAPGAQEVVAVGAIITLVVGLIGGLAARSTAAAIDAAAEARARAEGAAAQLDAANRDLERRIDERTEALRAALADAERRTAEQERLLAENRAQQETIRAMSAPLLPVTADTLVLPLVGALDEARLRVVQDQALAAVERSGARRLLIDVTGVPITDAQVAAGLLALIDGAKLLGAETVLVGVGPEAAQALVGLGLDLGRVRTARDLRQAIERR